MDMENDVQLIRRILSGSDEAFGILVRRHHKAIHALAWRKVGDFHVAEEIAQDTFVQVYKNLSQLRNPNQFSGWMYVIATRLCLKWIQKHQPAIQSLEDTPVEEIDEASYTHHVVEQQEIEIAEDRHELVEKLLSKLPESERTVVTLHYLGEMTSKEIGRYLGVSVNTIKSRLRRGRKRLQEEQEELVIRETFGSIQFPVDFPVRILEQVADLNPTPTSVPKPLLPWAAFGTAVVFVILMLGASNQYLVRYQRAYSFESESEPVIEIVDASIFLDIVSKPTIRDRLGGVGVPGKDTSTGIQDSQTVLNSNILQDSRRGSTDVQWTQGNAPPGGGIRDMFATSEGTVYAVAPTGMYRLTPDASAWTRVNTDIPIGDSRMPMAEHNGILYIISADAVFTSNDSGETWYTLGRRPTGNAVGFIVTDAPQDVPSQTGPTLYLVLQAEGVFRSTDRGTRWTPLNNGLTDAIISAVAAVENTLFAGTAEGLFRLDSDIWKKMPIETSRAVYSLAVFKNNLYVGTGPNLLGLAPIAPMEVIPVGKSHPIRIFHSADFGASWTEILHEDNNPKLSSIASGITLLSAGDTLLALGGTQTRSTDRGGTWTKFGYDTNMYRIRNLPAVAVNERVFYKTGPFGIHRTTDAGKTWVLFIDGMAGTRLKDLVVFNNTLYAHTGDGVYQSPDEGVSWKKLVIEGSFEVEDTSVEWLEQEKAKIYTSFHSKLAVDGNRLYFLARLKKQLQIFRLSTDTNVFVLVEGIPTFDDNALSPEMWKDSKVKIKPVPGGVEVKTVSVSGDVFYVEYKRNLFKWKLGDPEWINTGLIDTSHMLERDFRNRFKLAVSGETVYAGKRDGKLFQSFDAGRSWTDLTPNLPLRYKRFNEIVLVGSTVYVATDKGVLTSQTGEHWHVLTDGTGTHIRIDRFAVDGSTVYGIGDAGVYHLEAGWHCEQVASEVPDEVTALAICNSRLYSAIDGRGMFHISLKEE